MLLEPLPEDQYPLETRAAHLVRSMVAAKVHGAEAVFLADPFNPQHAVIRGEGAPGELFLAWRTAAMLLGDARYLESIVLPGASCNHLFARGSDVVMVAWNPRPTEEVLYLGRQVRQYDLWGRPTTPPSRAPREAGSGQQRVHVGPLPCFLTGLDGAVARWRVEFALEHDSVPSLLCQPQDCVCRWKNTFGRPVTGKVELTIGERWPLVPHGASFALAPGEEFRLPTSVTLPNEATAAAHLVRADFEIQADRPYRFSAFRQLQVGMENVRLEVQTRLGDHGDLEIEQQLVNQTSGRVSTALPALRRPSAAPAGRRPRFRPRAPHPHLPLAQRPGADRADALDPGRADERAADPQLSLHRRFGRCPAAAAGVS